MVARASFFQRLRMGFSFLPYFSVSGLRYFNSWLQNEKIHEFEGKLRINSFVPPWPSVAHDRLRHAAFSTDRIPFQVYYAVTGSCPYACPHCSYAHRSGTELTEPESLGFIDQVKQLGCSLIGFTGGEPLLRKDLEKLVSSCKPQLATILFTTGHGLTRMRAQGLKDADLDWFTVGMESVDEHIHDRIRNVSGSFKKAVNALDLAKDVRLYTAISTVASKSKVNSGEIERLYDFAMDHGVSELRIIPYVSTGGSMGDTTEMLDIDQYMFLTQFHKTMNRRKKGPVVESFSYIESAELYGCGAGFHHFFVDAAGNVCPCDLTPLSFGSVKEESLKQIWDRMGEFFPRPRLNCMMKEIAPKLKKDCSLPIAFDESKKYVPKLNDDEGLPAMYQFLKNH